MKNDVENDYTYDLNGNMISDANKGINSISYNHLNLPVLIIFDDTHKIEYLYDGTGVKVQKKVTNGALVTITSYMDGFQYTNGLMSFFPHAEGYVNVTRCEGCEDKYKNLYDYVFNYTDHLGNVRLSWALDKAPNLLKIVEENHYYPFGLKHTHYNVDHKHFEILPLGDGVPDLGQMPFTKMTQLNAGSTTTTAPVANKYKYNGKEYQDELGLNMYDYGARNYDPAIGRWTNMDVLAERYSALSPYAYVADNPIIFIDPDGKEIVFAKDATKEFKENFAKAIAYLKANKMDGLFAKLQDSDEVYTISEGISGSFFNPETNTIVWDDDNGIITSEGEILSPTTALNHEADHALQEEEHPLKKFIDKLSKSKYTNKEEERVIKGSEQRTAKALGEIKKKNGVTRKDHQGLPIKTKGPTSNVPVKKPTVKPKKK